MANNSILAKMMVQITANNTQFLGAMAKSNAATASFQKSILSAGKALGVTFGAVQLFNGIKSAIGVMADFEVQMSTVRAITGATGDQFKALEKNALDLGRSTRYTATQVGSLQVEYGRLGFTSKEIINATKSTLNLATATGSDLARSAEIAGSTLRAFQIDAKETGRVTDVIASALNKSALSLDSFGEGIKYVAPVAKATNVSLEETSALMSVLADAGIKGSQAGTSLRRIFTLLTKDGKPLSERLDELAKKGITLADANDEVGLYAQTALLVLANQNERVKELTETYKNANGETQRMADIMEDNLTGDVTKLTSAFQGLILEGRPLSNVLRGITQGLTDFVTSISGADARKLLEFEKRLAGFKNAIDDGNQLGSSRLKILLDEAKGLGIELTVLRDEFGNLTGIEKLVRDGLVGPLKESNDLLKIGAAAFAKSQAEKLKGLEDERKKQEELNKLYQSAIDLANERGNIENKRILESAAIRDFKASAGDRSDALRSNDGSSYLSNQTAPTEEGRKLWEIAIDQQKRYGDEARKAREEMMASRDADLQLIEDRTKAWLSFGQTVSGIISNVISSDRDFLASAQKTVAGILQANATQIASWLAVKFAKDSATKTPVVAIALLTAAIGVVSGLLGKDWKRGGVGGGGRYGGGNLSSTRSTDFAVASNGSQNSAPTITGVIRGQDLYVILENYKRNNQYTMSGG